MHPNEDISFDASEVDHRVCLRPQDEEKYNERMAILDASAEDVSSINSKAQYSLVTPISTRKTFVSCLDTTYDDLQNMEEYEKERIEEGCHDWATYTPLCAVAGEETSERPKTLDVTVTSFHQNCDASLQKGPSNPSLAWTPDDSGVVTSSSKYMELEAKRKESTDCHDFDSDESKDNSDAQLDSFDPDTSAGSQLYRKSSVKASKRHSIALFSAAASAVKAGAAVPESNASDEGGDVLLQRLDSDVSSLRGRSRTMISSLSLVQKNMDSPASQTSFTNFGDILDRRDASVGLRCKAFVSIIWTRTSPNVKDPYVQAFVAWLIWLVSGTLFFKYHTSAGWCKAVFQSVSIGYGIFWFPIDSGSFSNAYIRLHFVVGVAAIGGVMAVFARSLVDSKARWYVEAIKQQALEAACNTDGIMDDIVAYIKFYWPKIHVHVYFWMWTLLGVLIAKYNIFGSSITDAMFFCLSAMTSVCKYEYYVFLTFLVRADCMVFLMTPLHGHMFLLQYL